MGDATQMPDAPRGWGRSGLRWRWDRGLACHLLAACGAAARLLVPPFSNPGKMLWTPRCEVCT